MNYLSVLALCALALGGVFLLGKGLTGMTVSETCCFPPNCAEQNLCDSAKLNLENPSTVDSSGVYLGLILILLSILFYRLFKN
ncbi:MAG: hypothetical protein V1837_07740 [Candidatus Woesearchaeota archaeon]